MAAWASVAPAPSAAASLASAGVSPKRADRLGRLRAAGWPQVADEHRDAGVLEGGAPGAADQRNDGHDPPRRAAQPEEAAAGHGPALGGGGGSGDESPQPRVRAPVSQVEAIGGQPREPL